MRFPLFALCGAIAIDTVTAVLFPPTNPGCKADIVFDGLLNAVDGIGASKFCSSFILQTKTVTSTYLTVQQSLTTSTLPDVQTTTTNTDFITTTTTLTSFITLPNPTVTEVVISYSLIARNNGQPPPRPPPPPPPAHPPPPPPPPPPRIANYASNLISSACSCFITSAPVTTVVSTTLTSTTIISTSILPPLHTDTIVSSVTVVVSDIISTKEIFPPTSTVTEQVTTTDIVSQCTNAAAAPKYSQAVGNYAAVWTGQEINTGSELSCCQLCYEQTSCVSYMYAGLCYIYLVGAGYGEGRPSPECPSGILPNSVAINDGFSSGGYDMVKLGPCGTP